jgi:hypothetical protein
MCIALRSEGWQEEQEKKIVEQKTSVLKKKAHTPNSEDAHLWQHTHKFLLTILTHSHGDILNILLR